MSKTALVTGVTGQDGAYLAEFLLDKGYTVHGVKRRSSSFNTARVDHLYKDRHEANVRFFLDHGDMTDSTNLIRLVQECKPDEIYNLAAQSHVGVSFELPGVHRRTSDALGTLQAAWRRCACLAPMQDRVRFYQASTSELYGNAPELPAATSARRSPRASPYAAAKLLRLLAGRQLPRGVRACTPPTASSSTTKARCAARPS